MDRLKRKNRGNPVDRLRGARASAPSKIDMTNPTVSGVDLGDSSSLATVLSPSGDVLDKFTFKMYHGVEPTNNHAERQLREPIIHRKIRGQLKSEKGILIFNRLVTAVSTWKLQGLIPFVEFRRYL